MTFQVVVMGVSGAGKSTVGERIAATLGLPFRDADDFHPSTNIAKMSRGEALDDTDRTPWLDAIGAHLAGHAGHGCVVTCSALKRAYRDRLRAIAPTTQFLFLNGDPTLIAARQESRKNHFMPASLVASQFAALEPPAPEEHAILLDVAEPPEALAAYAIAAMENRP